MHEFSLVQGMMRQLVALADKHGAQCIHMVTVSIGVSSGIVVDSFRFGFEALAAEQHLTNKAKLHIVQAEGNDLILDRVEME